MIDDDFKNRLFGKLDKIDDRLNVVDVTLVKQEGNLAEHMRRSLANEKAVEILEEKLVPLETHVNLMNAAFKLVGIIAILLGIVTGFIKVFEFFKF